MASGWWVGGDGGVRGGVLGQGKGGGEVGRGEGLATRVKLADTVLLGISCDLWSGGWWS